MMDWTDRHCRFFHRLIAPNARLYTEMITTGAILHGDLHRLLDFNPEEHPVALQLGGSEPADLAASAREGQQWGYDEINLNCGCPSERVQKGAFGACLMKEPALVADGIKAMQDAVSIPVTVKHRIGVDELTDYSFVRDFVGALFDVGCRVFVVHARGAILKGLSPKENREIPPLRMEVVRMLKRDFPSAVMVANGGITLAAQAAALFDQAGELPGVDGVMLGRAAYHDPWVLHDLDQHASEQHASEQHTSKQHTSKQHTSKQHTSKQHTSKQHTSQQQSRQDILPALQAYFEAELHKGVPAKHMTRHWHGLFHGLPGARVWRREICEGKRGPLELFEWLNAHHHGRQHDEEDVREQAGQRL
jgi:tRNA-dihydrouridine synthase A